MYTDHLVPTKFNSVHNWTLIFSETGQELLKSMSKAEFITSVTLAGRREMDLAADVAKEKFVQKIIDFEEVPSVSVPVLPGIIITLAIYYYP